MSHGYDTAEIKLTARRIGAAAAEVRELSNRDVRSMLEQIDAGMKGMTAEALKQRLGVVGSDILRISKGLDTVQRELLVFARRLEEADRKVSQEIGRK